MPPTPPVRNVTLSEYHFSYDTSVPAGRVVFRFTNDGKVQHRPILLPLDDDVPPIDVQLHGAERKVVPPFAGLRMRDPGQSGTFAVDLAPNHRYAFICYAIAADGQVHALKGMSSEFRTGPATSPLHK